MARIAYFDCLSGISGDMTLGALVDLGVDVAAIQSAIRSMGLPDLNITARTVKKCGFRAIKVEITHPPEHAHRHLHHITEMIQRSSEISDEAKRLAQQIFLQVAEAEARVHGSTVEKIHFHEVGAVDSIADIVGTAVAMTTLGIDQVMASPVPTGMGTVTIAHGRVSIPAPATAELLCNVPIASSNLEAELTTPTGAAILKATAIGFGPVPAMTTTAVGYGAGTKDLIGQANVLRVMLGETDDPAISCRQIDSDRVIVLETNIDDSTPEQLADCASRLIEAGALDVFQTPCTMKKGRSGVTLTLVCRPCDAGPLESIVFEHTSSIGIRRHVSDRHKLQRRLESVASKFGPVAGKVVVLPSGKERFSVEDDEARRLAKEHGVAASDVRRDAISVWEQTQQS